jgi:quinohemoprotein amine dehydrogenase
MTAPLYLPQGESFRAHRASRAAAPRSWRRVTGKLLLLALLAVPAPFALAARPATPPAAAPTPAAADPETEPGIPVTDALTREKCGSCHVADGTGNLSRISWVRTTPEGWAQAIKRMVKLNGLVISAGESRAVVRYLASSHGLAPEEARPVAYMPEHRIVEEANIPNETVRAACASCHAFGQPLSWRRSATEWKLLQDMHVALYSQAEVQYRRPVDERGIAQNGGGAAKGPTPGEVALEYVRKVAPLHTPEWAAWSARMRSPRLDGKWLVSATLPGRGRYFGEMVVAPGARADEFATTITLRGLDDGKLLERRGNGIVYAGYAWRGRNGGGATGAIAADSPEHEVREALLFSPDQKSATGRWFWGDYEEFGFDVQLLRADAGPVIAAVTPAALKAGSSGVEVHLFGAALPPATAGDIDLGAGVKVTRLVSAAAGEIVAVVDVAPTALVGRHDAGVGSTVFEAALPVYAKVDYIKVAPDASMARLGGSPKHPKGYQQLAAIGYDKGPDGKVGTADDVAIGPVPVNWSIDEFQAVYGDDDKQFVGGIDQNGLFTPAIDGPNPQRRFGRNNYGDVWAVASAKDLTDELGKPLGARSYLVVTVPAYKQWDQPEVAQ